MPETILIVDNKPFCRDLLTLLFQRHDFATEVAVSGDEALQRVQSAHIDVILLELDMPGMSGLEFLARLRQCAPGAKIPAMILTDVRDKAAIIRAATLGVRDYVIRSCCNVEVMVGRIRQMIVAPAPHLVTPPASGPAVLTSPPKLAKAAGALRKAPANTTRTTASAPRIPSMSDWPKLLTRDQTLERLDHVTTGKTIAGVVAQVIALAGSPEADMADVVRVIQSDPILAARVLQLANSAGTGVRKRINSLDEATRTIGLKGIQNMAVSVGIFGTFPPDEKDGFNTLRCWQHSFAVADLMAMIVRQRDPQQEGLNYLVGLCHDLGEILLRQHFATEYDQILNYAGTHGLDAHGVESVALGIRHPELISRMFSRMGLPQDVVHATREFFEREIKEQSAGMSTQAQILILANLVSHGLLLAASTQEVVRPISRTEWRTLTDKAPPEFDIRAKRNEIVTATGTLARLPAKEEQRMFTPLIEPTTRRIAYVRPETFIALDPLAFALDLICTLTIMPAFPANLDDFDGIVVVGLRPGVAPAIPPDLAKTCKAAGRPDMPVMVLVGQTIPESRVSTITLRPYPLRLVDIQNWLEGITPSPASAELATAQSA